MTKEKLRENVDKTKSNFHDALQTLFDSINKGQRKQLVKKPKIKAILDRFGVNYEG